MLSILLGALLAMAAVAQGSDNPIVDIQYALAGAKVTDQVTEVALQNLVRAQSALQLVTDIDVLLFSLNLEYLAANFWSCAATGKPLEGFALTGFGPAPLGCKKANLSPENQAIAEEVAFDEAAHVLLLRSTLGKFAFPQPLIDLNAAAKIIEEATNGGLKIDPSTNDDTFAVSAFVVSDIEPTAYRGALPLLKSKVFISVTAGLLATESHHAGVLRKILVNRRGVSINGYTIESITQAISDKRDTLDRQKTDFDQGITLTGKPNLVPTDTNGLIFPRSPSQLLAIFYNGGLNGGGFFPKGLNARVRNQLQG